jgi:putative ABC transport system permease protein
METVLQDIKYGTRMLVKHPGFAIMAVLTLGIGIGATTAIFSVIDALILRPLPQKGPGQLVCFRSINQRQGRVSPAVFGPTVEAIAKQNGLFSDLCYFNAGWTMQWERNDFFEEVWGARVSANFVAFWDTVPLLGRGFLADEGKPGQESVIVLSHRFWRKRLGGRDDIVGQAIRFDGGVFTVVGIMPRHFRFPAEDCDFWIPSIGFDNDFTSFGVAARLRPGISRAQAQAALDTVLPGHLDAAPRYWRERYGGDIDVAPLRSLFILSMGDAYGILERILITVFGAVVFVLLIGCVNTANLILARTQARQKEVALRAALGAGRSRLARQLLTESSLLALLGGLAGVGLSWFALRVLVASIPWYIPRVRPIELNLAMLGFTLSVSLLAGLIVGLAPVVQVCRGRLEQALKEGTPGAGGSVAAGRFRSCLVVSEVALAVILLVAAGLTTRSVAWMLDLDPGYEPAGLLRVSLRLPTRSPPDSRHMISQGESILARLAVLPRVESAGIRLRELGLGNAAPEGQSDRSYVPVRGVGVESRDTLRTMRVRLLAGRYLDRSDARVGGRTVIVNRKLAESFWHGQNAVGKRLTFSSEDNRVTLEVVGVVSDIRPALWEPWGGDVLETVYRPARAMDRVDDWAAFVLRTGGNPASLIPAVSAELKAQGLARSEVNFSILAQDLYESTVVPRLFMAYVSGFATVGLVLAAIGIYGVLSYSVVQRTHEIGVRMTLGARPTDVFARVIKTGLSLILVGLLVGAVGALALTRVLTKLLYGVTPTDPATFVAVSLLLTVVGLIACYIPARRATKIDPMTALRYE